MSGRQNGACRAGAGPVGQWLVVVLLALVAGALAGQLLSGAAPASGQTGSPARTQGVLAVAGQVTRDTYGLYLVDLRNSTICMYQYLHGERCLRLMAARTFIYDRQLDSYNTKPSPTDIAKMVANARRLKDVKTKP